MEHDFDGVFKCFESIFICFLLSVTYLASLHVWDSRFSRDHPTTIKKRFISAFTMLFISPLFLYTGLDNKTLEQATFLEIMGLRYRGLIQAIFVPLFLTMLLFLGPISMELCTRFSKLYDNKEEEFQRKRNRLILIRNHLVAPLSEEFTYRSCMLPVLLESFSPTAAILGNPLFFGVAHFHHMWERIHHMGMSFDLALKISCFQFTYTTLFGMYSAYLFHRTGHFVTIFLVHAFCNHMGFPDIVEIGTYNRNKKAAIACVFVVGFASWCVLLAPLTEPRLYQHELLVF